jgi:glycosyltransferase involved in cell wall biosynthesis
VSVIYNAINPDKLDRIARQRKEKLSDSEPYIIFYGRLFWKKGLTHLLEAFAIVRKDCNEVKLKIFGEGPLEPKLRQKVQEMGFGDCVSIHGHVAYEKLIGEIKGATVVALPSLREGQPVAALEAMALGKPLVAFDLPYAREFLVDGENALLARACDVRDLSRKIVSLLFDKNLRYRIGDNARSYVRRRHNWDSTVEQYLQVYEKVLSARVAENLLLSERAPGRLIFPNDAKLFSSRFL